MCRGTRIRSCHIRQNPYRKPRSTTRLGIPSGLSPQPCYAIRNPSNLSGIYGRGSGAVARGRGKFPGVAGDVVHEEGYIMVGV